MKHIHDILSGYGLTVPEDRRADFDRELGENYATAEAMTGLQNQLKTATDGLKAFEGVDVNALNGRITQLTNDLAAQAAAHKKQLDERDFNDALKTELDKLTFTSLGARKAVEAEVRAKCSKLTDGKIIGFNDAVEAYRKADPAAFPEPGAENRPYFTAPAAAGAKAPTGKPDLGSLSMADYIKARRK